MRWVRRTGVLLFLAGLICIIPTFLKSEATSRLRAKAREVSNGRQSRPEVYTQAEVEQAEAKAAEAEAAWHRWLAAVYGCAGSGLILLTVSFYSIPRERRLQWVLSMGLLLVGGILTVVCSELPARTGTAAPRMYVQGDSPGSEAKEVTESARPDTVAVGEVALARDLPLRLGGPHAAPATLGGIVVTLFAALLPVGRRPVWHFIRSSVIAAAALLIVASAVNVFVATPPYSDYYVTNYHLAYGCWVNLLAALMVGAGAALRVPLDWFRTAAVPAAA